jgi:predicted N-acyltransferase
MISVERIDSIASIDRSEWDRLAGDNVLASWGWLRTVEETHLYPRHLAYFVARGSEGLLAAAPCSFEDATPARLGIDLVVFGRFAKYVRSLGISTLPALICGTSSGLADHVLIPRDRPPQERSALLRQMIDAIEETAAREQSTLCFRNVVESDDGDIAQTLRARGYLRATEMPSTFLDVEWNSFPEYVRHLKRSHPSTAKNVSRELKRASRAGITFRELPDPAALQDRLHAILDRHNRRLNGEPFPYRADFLSTLKRNLGERSVFFLAAKDAEPLGIVVGARSAVALYLVMVGFDETKGRDGFLYFNNSYNEPIRYAIDRGLRRVYSGKLVYEVKTRRGFQLLGLGMYLRVPGRLNAVVLRPMVACQSALIRSRIARQTTAPSRARDT